MIANGWHINSNITEQASQIPTQLKLPENSEWQLTSIIYPDAIVKTLDFGSEPLTLFEGSITIKSTLTSIAATPVLPIPMTLVLQACNQDTCLAAETIQLRLYKTTL